MTDEDTSKLGNRLPYMRDAIPREAASVRVAVYGWDSTARRYRVRSGSAYSDSGASLGVSSNEATGLACVASRQSRRWLDGIRWFSCMSYSMAFVHTYSMILLVRAWTSLFGSGGRTFVLSHHPPTIH